METVLNLMPEQDYLLTWTNEKNDIVVLKCKFIKYYNNSYLNSFIQYNDVELKEYHDNYEEGGKNILPKPPAELVGTVLDKKKGHQILKHEFDNELYPYYKYKMRDYRSAYIGLFRFVKIVNVVRNGQKIDVPENDILRRHKLSHVVYTDTRNLLDNTLMWVCLEKDNFSIIPNVEE